MARTLSDLLGTKVDEFRIKLARILSSGLSAQRTYTLQDRSGTLADDTDITNAKARANHTGTQAISTVTSLQTALDAKQDLDSDLTTIGALSPSNDDILQRKSGAWTARTTAQYKTDLALVKADVGLGNVDNTSDATKNSATATLTNKTVSLTAAHGSDDTYEGLQIPGLNNTGGVTQWDAVYLNGSSQWALADANGTNTFPARGLAVATVSTGNATTVLIRGTVRNDAWNWTPGGTIYLSTTAGGLTQTAPSGSGDKIQAVGFALTADIAFFDFNSLFLTKS